MCENLSGTVIDVLTAFYAAVTKSIRSALSKGEKFWLKVCLSLLTLEKELLEKIQEDKYVADEEHDGQINIIFERTTRCP